MEHGTSTEFKKKKIGLHGDHGSVHCAVFFLRIIIVRIKHRIASGLLQNIVRAI